MGNSVEELQVKRMIGRKRMKEATPAAVEIKRRIIRAKMDISTANTLYIDHRESNSSSRSVDEDI